jgi:ornithine--oxo-acid transaminase
LSIVSRAYYTDKLGIFLEKICQLTGFEKALPMNTGAEAVETALKAVRKWAYTVKGVPHDQAEIIACAGNFHGRTTTIISMSSTPQYRAGFGPFTPGLKIISYGNAAELEKAITPHTAGFIVEPIKGEGGDCVTGGRLS